MLRRRGGDGNLWGGEMRWREWSRRRKVAWHTGQLKTSDKTNFDRISFFPFSCERMMIIFFCYSHLKIIITRDARYNIILRYTVTQTHCTWWKPGVSAKGRCKTCSGTMAATLHLHTGIAELPELCNALFTQFKTISLSASQSKHLGYCFLPRQLLIATDRHCLDSERCASL